jgi:hypothetical protein
LPRRDAVAEAEAADLFCLHGAATAGRGGAVLRRMNPLVEALDLAGGIQTLARKLRVPSKQLGSWIEGEVETPHSVWLRALDLIRQAKTAAHILG